MSSEPSPPRPLRWLTCALLVAFALLTAMTIAAAIDPLWLGALSGAERRDSADWWRHYGADHLHRGDLAGALSAYHKALSLAPDDAATHLELGIVLLQLRRPQRAAEQLERALAAGPRRRSLAHTFLARAYVVLGRHRLADQHFRQAAAAAPDPTDARAGLGALLLRHGRRREAIGVLSRALRDYLDLKLHYRAALLRFRRSNPEQRTAVAEVERHLARGVTDSDLARYDLTTLRAARERSLKVVGLRLLLGQALVDDGQIARGLAQLRAAARVLPHDRRVLAALRSARAARPAPSTAPTSRAATPHR